MTSETTGQSLSILIVDDDTRVRHALARCLELDGHIVEIAESGRAALDQIDSRRWDLLCVDAQLPDIPGQELACLLQPRARDAYIVLVTGYASSFDDTVLLTKCIDAVLPKPWKVEELELVLQRVQDHALSQRVISLA